MEWEGILPRFCESYVKEETGSTANLFRRLDEALDMIQKDNYDLVMVSQYMWCKSTEHNENIFVTTEQ